MGWRIKDDRQALPKLTKIGIVTAFGSDWAKVTGELEVWLVLRQIDGGTIIQQFEAELLVELTVELSAA